MKEATHTSTNGRENRTTTSYSYVKNREANALIHGALKRIESLAPEMAGLSEAMLHAPSEAVVVETTIEMCLDMASALNGSRDLKHANPQSEAFFGIASAISSAYSKDGHEHQSSDTTTEASTSVLFGEFTGAISQKELSSGIKFIIDVDQTALEVASNSIRSKLEAINKPFTEVREEIRDSLEKNLVQKNERLETNDTLEEEEKAQLTADVIAITANLRFLDILLDKGTDWDNYEDTCAEITESIQDAIARQGGEVYTSRIIESETELQAINSLKSQFREWTRKKQNAAQYLHGSKDKAGSGLMPEAVQIRRKRLSINTDQNGVPELNKLSSTRLANWLSDKINEAGLPIKTAKDLADLFSERSGDEFFIYELLESIESETGLNDSSTLPEFISEVYVTSESECSLNRNKADFMRLVTPELEDVLSVDIKGKFDRINAEVASETETEDLVEAEFAREKKNQMTQVYREFEQIIEFYDVLPEDKEQFLAQNHEQIASVLLASYELRKKANDNHLNPEAVLLSLCRASIGNEPLSLQTIRCLRWCYPNMELEITPHAGDWDTFSKDGQPISRREWVDKKKLELFKEAVIDPIQHHNIPIGEVVLLATGDYDIVGGYGYDKDDEQSKNARAYVVDVRQRVKDWCVFGDLPTRTISFRELIDEYGDNEFEKIRAEVEKEYDLITKDHRRNYVGYNSQQVERLVDAEHNSRTPFLRGWTREMSRRLTRHKAIMELSIGVLIAKQNEQYPTIVTVSGTGPAAQTFSKGHRISGETPVLGLTLFKSINDGDQPDYYRQASSVV